MPTGCMPTGRTTAPGTGVRRTHDPCLQLGFAASQPIVPPPRRWTVPDVLHARDRTAVTAPRSGRTSQVDRIEGECGRRARRVGASTFHPGPDRARHPRQTRGHGEDRVLSRAGKSGRVSGLDTALRAMRQSPAERRTLERCPPRSGDSPLIVDRGERCGAREDGCGHRAGAALFRGRNHRTSAPRVVARGSRPR